LTFPEKTFFISSSATSGQAGENKTTFPAERGVAMEDWKGKLGNSYLASLKADG